MQIISRFSTLRIYFYLTNTLYDSKRYRICCKTHLQLLENDTCSVFLKSKQKLDFQIWNCAELWHAPGISQFRKTQFRGMQTGFINKSLSPYFRSRNNLHYYIDQKCWGNSFSVLAARNSVSTVFCVGYSVFEIETVNADWGFPQCGTATMNGRECWPMNYK